MMEQWRSDEIAPRVTARLAAAYAATTRALVGLYRKLVSAQLGAHAGHERFGQDLPVLDREVFQELRDSLGNRPEALRSIYMKFIGHASAYVNELRVQSSSANARTLHTLKGSAAMVGAKRIAGLAARLQDSPSELRSPSMEAALAELECELGEFRAAFEAELE
jgi:HPt (histidine-containing phosphotransfer) domain-containing protein